MVIFKVCLVVYGNQGVLAPICREFPPAVARGRAPAPSNHPPATQPTHHQHHINSFNQQQPAATSSKKISSERSFATTSGVEPPIHPPPLGVFIIYFSHLLRFTEVRRLTRYIHPARFAAHNYRLDRESEVKAMTVDYDGLDVVTLAALVAKIRSTSAEVPATTRVPLLPQSMPGSQIVGPLSVTRGEPPSNGLSNLCLLNDIRVLGIPSYHKRDGNYMQMVGLPMRWTVKWVRYKR